MPRLSSEIKDSLTKDIKNGISINKISKNLNLGKSTIYYYYKKIKGKKYKEAKFISKLSRDEGEILGIIIGDGTVVYYKKSGHYHIRICFGNKKYALYVKEKVEKFFNKKFKLYKYAKNTLVIVTYSKKIYLYFKGFLDFKDSQKYCTVSVKNLEKLPQDFKKGLLKGLIDTDGCISNHKDKRIRISFYTTSKKLSRQFGELLEKFNFEYGIYNVKPRISQINGKFSNSRKGYSIFIYKKDTFPFIKLIKPYKSNKINGLVV